MPVHLLLSGNHCEVIHFDLISLLKAPLVLCHPWLILHNPHVDWSSGNMLDWSFQGHLHCLYSAHSPSHSLVSQSSSETPSLSSVPAECHDLGEVFNKAWALSLSQQCPYNCPIDFLLGAPLHKSNLYDPRVRQWRPKSMSLWLLV